MNTRHLGTALALGALLGGCAAPHSETPLATNFPTTKQPKVQAAGHWSVIARDVAAQIARDLKDERPLFVRESSARTHFNLAFEKQLISALIEQGRTVNRTPQGALVLEFDTRTLRFSADRPQYRHSGTATMLAAGLWGLAVADASAAGVATAGVAGADAYGWFRSEFASGATPQTEIIITAQVSDEQRFLAHRTHVYYVADGDRALYDAGSGTHTIRLNGDQ